MAEDRDGANAMLNAMRMRDPEYRAFIEAGGDPKDFRKRGGARIQARRPGPLPPAQRRQQQDPFMTPGGTRDMPLEKTVAPYELLLPQMRALKFLQALQKGKIGSRETSRKLDQSIREQQNKLLAPRQKRGVPRTPQQRMDAEKYMDKASNIKRGDMDPFKYKRQVMGEKKLTDRKTGDVYFGKEVKLKKKDYDELKRLQRTPDRRMIDAMMTREGVEDPRDLSLPSDRRAGITGRITQSKDAVLVSPDEPKEIDIGKVKDIDTKSIRDAILNRGSLQEYGDGPPAKLRAKIYRDAIRDGAADFEFAKEHEMQHKMDMAGKPMIIRGEVQTTFWEVKPGMFGYERAVEKGHIAPDGKVWYTEF